MGSSINDLEHIIRSLPDNPRVVVLTGAGISAESGIRTFRAADGLWEEHRVEEVATPEAFVRDPGLVQRFYNERRRHLLNDDTQPNPAHRAIGELARTANGNCLVVTQNVDDLHDREESRHLLHMHGELLRSFCVDCGSSFAQRDDLEVATVCANCGATGSLRPDIVWFGEMPKHMDEIYQSLALCHLFIAVGTSGNVYPAAGFVQAAREAGAYALEVNIDASEASHFFHAHLIGPAGEVLPGLVQQLQTRF